MPTVYNKVTVNNQTLIDLSQDTVSSAADIVAGKVGHLNNGTQVTGTAITGVDIPVFSITLDSSGENILSAVCNKTFAECLGYIPDGGPEQTAAVMDTYFDGTTGVVSEMALHYFTNTSSQITYVGMASAHPNIDVIYHSNGTINLVAPSIYVADITATSNGMYYNQNGGVLNSVEVAVPQPTGSINISTNGTHDVTNYASAVVNVQSGGSSKNVQTVQSTTRRNSTSLGSIASLTCSTAGTYDVYWTCARSNTSQTWGSRLYIDGTAYGTENTSWNNNVQNNHLTGVTIPANVTVAVYGRSRSGYYIYAPQLTIVQT